MLRITVEFLHGVFRGTGADDDALTGREADAEWPPSPARLYQALVAGGGTGARCSVPDGIGSGGLSWLESAPVIYADAFDAIERSSILDRFVVVDERKDGSVQNYPARAAQATRSGSRVAPRVPVVVYEWADSSPSERDVAGLQYRAARVGYLGCADSPVRLRVDTADVANTFGLPAWMPGSARPDTRLGIATPGWLDVLDAAFDDWSSGSPRRRSWIPTTMMPYAASRGAVAGMGGRSIWLKFDRAIQGRFVVAVAEALRGAVLERYTALIAGGDRSRVPEVLHGHHAAGAVGRHHVHWLPLPFAGRQYADGRIRGACIWLPDDATSLHDDVRVAVGQIDRLVSPGRFDVAVSFTAGGGRDRAATTSASTWQRPSRRWISVFPVVHERRVKHGVTVTELGRWCEYAGLPAPVRARSVEVPLIAGAARLDPSDVFRSTADRRPFTHIEIEFAERVRGPVALGRGRHFGLGLMLPVDDSVRGGPHG